MEHYDCDIDIYASLFEKELAEKFLRERAKELERKEMYIIRVLIHLKKGLIYKTEVPRNKLYISEKVIFCINKVMIVFCDYNFKHLNYIINEEQEDFVEMIFYRQND